MEDARWEQRLKRERARRLELEGVIEEHARALCIAEERLRAQEERVRVQVEARTAELRAALQAAEAADRAKTAFLAQISHELRTPLHGLTGTIDALSRTTLDADQQHLLSLSEASAERLLGVIGEVLDFARVEAGELEFELRPTRLQDVVEAAASSFAAAAAQKGLSLTSELRGEHGAWALADSNRLAQVLANLLSNAVKFTEQGAITLTADVAAAQDDVQVTWTVADSGCGMPRAATDRIFDAFRQADAATTRRFGGTGLGLSIVKGLVEAMHGEISVASQRGQGTTFTVVTRHPRCERVAPSPPAAPVDLDLSGMQVLIVDDHPINRTLCRAMLRSCGCETIVATTGEEAIDTVAARAPDLVLMDCHMPGTSGVEAAREIRAAGFANPILAVSADVTADNAAAVAAAGMQGILGKPFRRADLLRAVADVLAPSAQT